MIIKNNKKLILFVIALFVIAGGCVMYYNKSYQAAKEIDYLLTVNAPVLPEYVESVTVHVCGEVKEEGLYSLPYGSRVSDAVEMAGGPTKNADLNRMDSLARRLSDGDKVYVPNVNDDFETLAYINNGTGRTSSSDSRDIVVNINTAGIEELTLVPGVGESTARAIYDYRESYGPFLSIEEIKGVPRIGDRTFENIRDNISIN